MAHELSPNVYGVETEYSVMITRPNGEVDELVGGCHSKEGTKLALYQQPDSNGTDKLEDDDFTDALHSLGIVRGEGDMLSNGGRFYLDPSGPEYATPECTTAEEAVLRMYDGDEIVFGSFKYLVDQEIIELFQLNRRIVDHNRTSRGIHINTNTNLGKLPTEEQILQLAALNVAKGAMFGSGGLMLDGEGKTDYYHSPRLAITNILSDSTFKKRALVRAPFKSDHPGNRIETISGDALNFAWPMRASMVMTNAVVGLMELDINHDLPQLEPKYFAHSAETVGRLGRYGFVHCTEGTGSRAWRPLNVLRQISGACLDIDEKNGYLDDESRQVLAEVIDVADKMEADPDSVAKQVESIARQHYIERKLGALSLDSEKACRLDFAWDFIGFGYAERLRRRGSVGWQGFTQSNTPSATKKRMVTPPQDTRAKIRAQHILDSDRANVVSAYDWSRISTSNKPEYLPPVL